MGNMLTGWRDALARRWHVREDQSLITTGRGITKEMRRALASHLLDVFLELVCLVHLLLGSLFVLHEAMSRYQSEQSWHAPRFAVTK
jgi:hypothetical protein